MNPPPRSSRRKPATIAAEIIRASSDSTTKTRILYSARLNYKQLERYLEGLTRQRLLESDKGRFFTSTSRGRAFLDSYDEVQGLARALDEKQRALEDSFQVDF